MKIAHTRVTVALEQVLQRSPRARPTCAYLPHSDTATHGPYCSTPREVHTCIFSLILYSSDLLCLLSVSLCSLVLSSLPYVSPLVVLCRCLCLLSLSFFPAFFSSPSCPSSRSPHSPR